MLRFPQRLEALRHQMDDVVTNTGATIELWVGGDGETVTIPAAAQMADGWSGFGPPERFAQRRRLFEAEVLDCGRSLKDVSTNVLATRHDRSVSLDDWREAGASEVVVSIPPDGTGGYNVDMLRELCVQRGDEAL